MIYPEFVRVRKRYQQLDRCCTYWTNRALEADRKAKEEEGKVTFVPADVTRDKLEQQVEKFKSAFKQMSADQQNKMITDIRNSIDMEAT